VAPISPARAPSIFFDGDGHLVDRLQVDDRKVEKEALAGR
jgi:hypothetical protein